MRKDVLRILADGLKERGNDGDMRNMLLTKQCGWEHALGLICLYLQ